MKWYGKIAFTEQESDGTGIWEPKIIEREYYGDVIKMSKRDSVPEINPNITVTNQLSVVADPFLLDSFTSIAYVTCFGQKWRVSSVEVNFPRLTLTFGSLYMEDNESSTTEE